MIFAIAMVRDEVDIIQWTVTHMLEQCDAVIVADNGSVDGTREKLDELAQGGNLIVREDREVGYYQSQKMTALALQAAEMGATWVVPFDADELWLSRDGRPLSRLLDDLPNDILIARADLWDHVATGLDEHHPNPIRAMSYRRAHPAPLPKVAVRPLPGLTIAQGNHSASYATRDLPGTVTHLLTIRHYPYRTVEQTIGKVRNGAQAYAATDLPADQGGHWRGWGRILHHHGEDAIADLYRKWHWRAEPAQPICIDGEHQPPLVYDPAPYPRPPAAS